MQYSALANIFSHQILSLLNGAGSSRMSCMLGFTICLYLPLWVLCLNKIHQIIISLSCKFTAFCISPLFHTISVVSGPGEAVLNGTLFTVGKKPGPSCSKLTMPLVKGSSHSQVGGVH